MSKLEQVIAECREVKPRRWKYKGYRSEADALVRIPYGYLQTLLGAALGAIDNGRGKVSARDPFAVIAARSDETPQAVQPERQERDQRQNKDA